MKVRGVIKGHTLIFDEPLGLPEGQIVEAEITPTEGEAAGFPNGAEDRARVARRELLAKYGIRPTPSRGYVVTNEMVNKIRDELGI